MKEARQDTLAATSLEFHCECGASLGKIHTRYLGLMALDHDVVAELTCPACSLQFEIRKVSVERGTIRLKHDRKAS